MSRNVILLVDDKEMEGGVTGQDFSRGGEAEKTSSDHTDVVPHARRPCNSILTTAGHGSFIRDIPFSQWSAGQDVAVEVARRVHSGVVIKSPHRRLEVSRLRGVEVAEHRHDIAVLKSDETRIVRK